ncbi:MAG: hypothetical protein ABFS43_14925 [Thermodesulfobacteriota bacterium]
MKTNAWSYLCQDKNGDEYDEGKERWVNPEEVPEDDNDEDEEMDEM